MRHPRLVLALAVSVVAGIAGMAACSRPSVAPAGAWQRIDLWIENPQVELWAKPSRPFSKKISFLGAAEVRDMSKVPLPQRIAFPTRTAGQVRAIEQQPGSRLKWHLRLPHEPYFSFVPLGSEAPCDCTYRMGVRAAGKIEELYKIAAAPVGPISKATAEVDLSPWAGQEVDLLLQIDGPPSPPPAPAPLPGAPGAPPAPAPLRPRRPRLQRSSGGARRSTGGAPIPRIPPGSGSPTRTSSSSASTPCGPTPWASSATRRAGARASPPRSTTWRNRATSTRTPTRRSTSPTRASSR